MTIMNANFMTSKIFDVIFNENVMKHVLTNTNIITSTSTTNILNFINNYNDYSIHMSNRDYSSNNKKIR